jgi:hypothetical protein
MAWYTFEVKNLDGTVKEVTVKATSKEAAIDAVNLSGLVIIGKLCQKNGRQIPIK